MLILVKNQEIAIIFQIFFEWVIQLQFRPQIWSQRHLFTIFWFFSCILLVLGNKSFCFKKSQNLKYRFIAYRISYSLNWFYKKLMQINWFLLFFVLYYTSLVEQASCNNNTSLFISSSDLTTKLMSPSSTSASYHDTSLTKVSRFNTKAQDSIYNDETTTNTNKDTSSSSSMNEKDHSESPQMTEKQLFELILFDGLSIEAITSKTQWKSDSALKKPAKKSATQHHPHLGLVDKTNMNYGRDKAKKMAKKSFTAQKIMPKKSINIAYLCISDEMKLSMDQAVKSLKNATFECATKSTECVIQAVAKVSEQYNQRTTHLIVDCKSAFEDNLLSVNDKLVLVLAALNKCKIVRYQWLKKSCQKMKWIDDANYLLENYIDEDLASYDQDHFDTKLICKIIKNFNIKLLDYISYSFLYKYRKYWKSYKLNWADWP